MSGFSVAAMCTCNRKWSKHAHDLVKCPPDAGDPEGYRRILELADADDD